jgi:D-alanyl-D-alanine carboxypeptidase
MGIRYGNVAIRLFTAVLVAFSIAATPADAARARKVVRAPAPPKDAALIVDATSGRILYERDAYAVRHPASLTKMMTLYLLFEALQKGSVTMETPLTASAHAAAQSPTKIDIRPGQSIPVDLAIRAIVIRSANDVAVVIAEALGGTEANFAQMMTRKAREIGMLQTAFVNASGLPDTRQITTAADMAILGRHLAYDFPQYYPYFALNDFTYKTRRYETHDNLLGVFRGTDGIKTGYTVMSGFNLVSSVVRDGKHIVGVVMGGSSAASRDREMMRLLGIAFDEAEKNPLLVAHANVPWQPGASNFGPTTAPEWHAAPPPSIALAGFEGRKSGALPLPTPAEASAIASIEPVKIPPAIAFAQEQAPSATGPGAKYVVIPVPKPLIVSVTAVPAEDPIARLIAAENKSSVGIDGASYVPSGRLANILPSPKPLPVTLHPRTQLSAQVEQGDVGGPALGPSDRMKRWAVQIGAFADKITAHAHLAKYAEQSMDVLGQAKRLVVPVAEANGRTTYRARFGLFAESEARAVCKRMTSRGETCFAVQQSST